MSVLDPAAYLLHTAVTDPGAHRGALAAVGADPRTLWRAATRTILHYTADAAALTPVQLADIDLRRVRDMLDTAERRAPGTALTAERPAAACLAGCCRDHSLLSVAVLREHGIPARTRVGFTDYLVAERPGIHVDHVVVERWTGERWQRFDPELDPGRYTFDVADIPTGAGAPFETAAEVWQAWRAGGIDADLYGASGGSHLRGAWFIQGYVLLDLAHLMRVETLLWDVWGVRALPGQELDADALALTDRIARLTIAYDRGDPDAAGALVALWQDDARVRPTGPVRTFSPTGRVGTTDLATPTTVWEDLAPTP